jgi:hypothetical protein
VRLASRFPAYKTWSKQLQHKGNSKLGAHAQHKQCGNANKQHLIHDLSVG